MRTLLAVSLIVASVAMMSLLPMVSANHDLCPASAACAGTYSVMEGDCAASDGDAYGFNGVGASSDGPIAMGGGAWTQCYVYPGEPYYGSGNAVGGGVCVRTGATVLACTWWAWYQNTNAWGYGCHTELYHAGAFIPWTGHDLGCPAGAPPLVQGGILP